ncbi:unnamed protein product [Boreogadus saida]
MTVPNWDRPHRNLAPVGPRGRKGGPALGDDSVTLGRGAKHRGPPGRGQKKRQWTTDAGGETTVGTRTCKRPEKTTGDPGTCQRQGDPVTVGATRARKKRQGDPDVRKRPKRQGDPGAGGAKRQTPDAGKTPGPGRKRQRDPGGAKADDDPDAKRRGTPDGWVHNDTDPGRCCSDFVFGQNVGATDRGTPYGANDSTPDVLKLPKRQGDPYVSNTTGTPYGWQTRQPGRKRQPGRGVNGQKKTQGVRRIKRPDDRPGRANCRRQYPTRGKTASKTTGGPRSVHNDSDPYGWGQTGQKNTTGVLPLTVRTSSTPETGVAKRHGPNTPRRGQAKRTVDPTQTTDPDGGMQTTVGPDVLGKTTGGTPTWVSNARRGTPDAKRQVTPDVGQTTVVPGRCGQNDRGTPDGVGQTPGTRVTVGQTTGGPADVGRQTTGGPGRGGQNDRGTRTVVAKDRVPNPDVVAKRQWGTPDVVWQRQKKRPVRKTTVGPRTQNDT